MTTAGDMLGGRSDTAAPAAEAEEAPSEAAAEDTQTVAEGGDDN